MDIVFLSVLLASWVAVKGQRSRWAFVLAGIVLVHLMTQTPEWSSGWRALILRAAGLGLAGIGAAYAMRQRATSIVRLGSFGVAVVLFPALGTYSIIWSVDVLDTVVKTIGFTVMATLFYCALKHRWVPDHEYLLSDLSTFVRVLSASIVVSYALSFVGVVDGWGFGGRFQGIFHNPNTLAALGMAALFPALYLASCRRSLAWLSTALLLCVPMLQSGSRGPLFAIIAALVCGYLLWVMRNPRPLPLLAGVGAVFALVFRNGLIGLLSESTTPVLSAVRRLLETSESSNPFNSRLIAWEDGIRAFERSPWLGHGWNATRTILTGGHAEGLVQFELAQAHSSYIEILIDLGLAGAAITVLLVLGLALQMWRVSGTSRSLLLAMGVIAGLALSVSESYLFGLSSPGAWLTWLAMFACYALPVDSVAEANRERGMTRSRANLTTLGNRNGREVSDGV